MAGAIARCRYSVITYSNPYKSRYENFVKEGKICYIGLEGGECKSKHYKYRNMIAVRSESLPMASREVKPLDCRTSLSSTAKRDRMNEE